MAQTAQQRAHWLAPSLLDIRTLFHHMCMGIMSRTEKNAIKHYGKILRYPCGIVDIMACSDPVFGSKGWEDADAWASAKSNRHGAGDHARKSADPEGEDLQRSMRRARAKVRRLALANDFRWFVTLTLDPMKVDRESPEAVTKKLNAWCSNMVQRRGLRYILVPELHRKGGIHFHGFFNDVMEVVDSGHTDSTGHKVYNLPGWTLGFTTAIELYGNYPQAVGYVCKYIGKAGAKVGGRWYYSGGALRAPVEEYLDISPAELLAAYQGKAIPVTVPGKTLAIVNGIVLDQVQKEGNDD